MTGTCLRGSRVSNDEQCAVKGKVVSTIHASCGALPEKFDNGRCQHNPALSKKSWSMDDGGFGGFPPEKNKESKLDSSCHISRFYLILSGKTTMDSPI